MDDINKFFKRFRCPSCDTFIQKAGNFNHHFKTCKGRVHIYPNSVYALGETLFNKFDGFGIFYNDAQSYSKTWLFLTLNLSASH